MIWARLVVLAVATLAVGCSKPATGERDQAPADRARPARALDPRAQEIAIYRQAAAEFVRDELGGPANSQPGGEPDDYIATDFDGRRYFDIIDCSPDRQSAPGRPAQSRVEFFTKRAAVLKHGLRQAGYSEEAFDRIVTAYEDRKLAEADLSAPAEGVLDEADAAELTQLAAQLDAARARSSPSLPQIRTEGGCGAGEGPAVFRSEPAGARIWIIPKFGFDVCRLKGDDPWNPDSCRRWIELEPGKESELSGRYVYRAAWPGGRESRGTREVQPASEDVQIYVVR